MQDERDLVTFTGEDGEDYDMEVLFYVFHEGDEYAVLIDAQEGDFECGCGHEDCEGHEHGEGCEHGEDCEDCEDCEGHVLEYYVMKVISLENDMEEFQVIEEELPESLRDMIQGRLMGEFDAEDEYDEDAEDPGDD